MTQPPPLPNRKKSANDWRAILVTLAYPGTGQFLQGRRGVAWVLTTITTLVFLWGVGAIACGGFEGFRESWNGGETDLMAGFRYVKPPLKALGCCYVVAFVDAVLAQLILSRRDGG